MKQAIDRRLTNYDHVYKSFSMFFNDEDLRAQLASKAHQSQIEMIQQTKADMKYIQHLEYMIDNLDKKMKHLGVFQYELA